MFTVAIDPGHGGTNTGAIKGTVGFDEIVEKDYVLDISSRILAQLDLHKINSFMTRISDETVDLPERGRRASYADFVLSVHCNASPDMNVKGFMAFHWPNNYWARHISRHLTRTAPEALYRTSQRLFPALKGVEWLKHARAVIGAYSAPCVLAEIGHLTNGKDRKYLLSEAGRKSVAHHLTGGVLYAHELYQERQNV